MLSSNFLGNGGHVLACIAFTEDNEVLAGGEIKFLEAAICVIIKIAQSYPEVIGNISHGFTVNVRKIGVSVAEAGSYGLINKQDIILSSPSVIISDDLVGLHVSGLDEVGSQLHEVT